MWSLHGNGLALCYSRSVLKRQSSYWNSSGYICINYDVKRLDTQNIPPKNVCNLKEVIFISVLIFAIILIITHSSEQKYAIYLLVTCLNVRSMYVILKDYRLSFDTCQSQLARVSLCLISSLMKIWFKYTFIFLRCFFSSLLSCYLI